MDTIKLPENFKDNLNIKRHEMPQIKGEDIHDFLTYLKNQQINIVPHKIRINKLRYIQNEYNPEKVKRLIELDKTDHHYKNRILISRDHYIIDGNHRALAYFNINPNIRKSTIKIDKDAQEIINIAKGYPKVFYKSVHENINILNIIKKSISEKN